MIQQSDIQGRLRLLRYGLIVVVVLTFFVVLLAPYAWATNYLEPADSAQIQIGDFLTQALIATAIAVVLALVVYVVYHYLLTKSLPLVGGGGKE